MKQTFQFIVFVLFLGCNLAYCQVSEVEGSYVLQEKNFLKQGQLVRFPANGINIVYEVRAKNDSTIEIKETTYLRGQVKSNQSFNARLKFKQGRIEFNEIWESGEVECYGYFAGREMVMTNKERLTNYVVSREVAIK